MADVKSPGIDEKLTPVKAQAVSRRRLTARPGFAPESLTVGFMMDRVTLGQVSRRVLRLSLSIPSFAALDTYIGLYCLRDEKEA
jgi:hypothetical protein